MFISVICPQLPIIAYMICINICILRGMLCCEMKYIKYKNVRNSHSLSRSIYWTGLCKHKKISKITGSLAYLKDISPKCVCLGYMGYMYVYSIIFLNDLVDKNKYKVTMSETDG